MQLRVLDVDDQGVQLSYIDSGVPLECKEDYATIFAVHGMCFSSPIYERVIANAGSANIRFVAINRRDYPGSTPLTPNDTSKLLTGSDQDKADFIHERGVEIASFVEKFVERHNLPPVSEDGKRGGFALLGWSLGNAMAIAAVANVDRLSSAGQARWTSGMRALILQEPPTASIGTPLPPKIWSPHIDTTMPEDLRNPFFVQWITSYFKHGDLSTRSLDVLSYIVPSTEHAPSIFSMSADQISRTIQYDPGASSDTYFMVFAAPQIHANYLKGCFDADVRQLLPKMKITTFTGDITCSFSLAAHWQMEDENKAHGGGFIDFVMIPGINHFVHWDDPVLALKIYKEAL
ncbi:Alpha/Beta hydrolase protein [Lenzites betulinus]|nr:Alpha/Beta hydrolase protein [Lenzites betulinus]